MGASAQADADPREGQVAGARGKGQLPFVLAYKGISPIFRGPPRFSGASSTVAGRVTLGTDAILHPFSVMRADGQVIQAGAHLFLGEHSSVHIAHDRYAAAIGDRVSIGRNSVVHACTIGDDCVVQEGVAVLDGATVGAGSIVAAGAVVFSRATLPPGHWCEGSPAVAVRALNAGELAAEHERLRAGQPYSEGSAAAAGDGGAGPTREGQGYVAATASIVGSGSLRMDQDSSVWFGCLLETGRLGIDIEAAANVQDNTVVRSRELRVRIGRGSTIGHNVLLDDCVVGARALVGMSSTLAPGTVVMDDAFVAAGSRTAPGQILETGWLWGGRPARRIGRVSDRLTQLIESTAITYSGYAAEFARNQAAVPIAVTT